MGINVELRDESGQVKERLENPLPASLAFGGQQYDVQNFPLTSGIDAYGDTIFNRQQMPQFLFEWQVLLSHVQQADLMLMSEVYRLAQRCRSEVHLYLAFIGD